MKSDTANSTTSEFLVVTAFALSIFFVRFDGFIVNLAMPSFVKIFNITVSMASWVALSYILAQVCAIMLLGKLCDRWDLKKIFMCGLSIFIVGSLLCGLSENFWLLIAFRCLQGFGGSVMLVSAYAAIPVYFPRARIGWALGIMTTSAALGVLLGPVVGGWIINDWSWHWLFWVNIPIGAVALAYCWQVIPDKPRPPAQSSHGLDWRGGGYSALALLLLIFALNQGRELGWLSAEILGSFIVSAVFFVIFYKRERSYQDPLLDIRLFDSRSFVWVVIAMIIGFFLFFGGNFLVPFYLTQQGLSPKHIGFAMTAFSIVYIPIALHAGKLSDKYSPRKLALVAMYLAAAAGFIFMLTQRCGGIWPALVYLVMTAVAYGMFFSPVNRLIINFAGEKNKGSASAIYNTAMAITMALGVALLETIYSEFNLAKDGFTAAFCVAAAACLAAGIILSLASSPKAEPQIIPLPENQPG